MKSLFVKITICTICALLTLPTFAKDYEDPFRIYNRKLKQYSKLLEKAKKKKAKSSKAKMKKKSNIKKYQGRVDTQNRIKRAKYAKLKKEYEDKCHKTEKRIEGYKGLIEKFSSKPKTVADYQKNIAQNEAKLEKLHDDFQNGVEAFYSE